MARPRLVGVTWQRHRAVALTLLVAAIGFARPVSGETPGDDTPGTGETRSIPLPRLEIAGQAETAGGPVEGYVATRSSAGTKTDTLLIETPQSISVITRDQMDAQNAQTINEAVRYSPGVRTDLLGADVRFDGRVVIRGFLADQYLDELPLLRGAFTAPTVDPWLLDRIDIVYGPGSVLYGQASPGGFLNLASKLPVSDPLHVMMFETGSYGRVQGAFDLGGPLNPDGTWLYRVAGLGRNVGSQVDFTTYQRLALAPAVTWRPTGDTRITLLGSLLDDPQAGFFNQLPFKGTVLFNPNGNIPTSFFQGDPDFSRFRRSQETIGYIAEHRLDETWQVRQNLRFLHQLVNYHDVYAIGFQPNLLTLNRDAFVNDEYQNAFALDNQALANVATGPLQHTFLFGLGYQHTLYDQTYREYATTPIDYLNPIYLPVVLDSAPLFFNKRRQSQGQTGIYAQDQVNLGRWFLTIGGRHDWLGSSTTNQLTNVTTSTSDSAFSWRAGLLYRTDFGVAPYYSYATSFQPTPGTSFSGAPFQPTMGRQSEIGIKYEIPGTRSLLTVALYNLTQQNVLTPDPTHANFGVQTGEIRSRGIELGGKVSLTDGLSVIASYAYLDNTTTQANNATVGKAQPGLPSNTAAGWAEYAFQSPGLYGLTIGGGFRYASNAYANDTNTIKIPAYGVFDAMIRYDLGVRMPQLRGVQLQLNATNLFDTRYISFSNNLGAYYGLRRAVLANVALRW